MSRPEPSYQAALARAALDPAEPVPNGFSTPDGATATRRFAVYRNNVVVGLVGALRRAYPSVERLVGRDFFDAMAGLFARAHPPRSPVLAEFGAELPDWLERFPPAASLPYLPDIARVDRARLEAFHAADTPALDAAAAARLFAGLAPEAIAATRLTVHPSLRLIASAHPVIAILARLEHGGGAVAAGASHIAVARPDEIVHTHEVGSGAFASLRAIAGGATLAEAAAAGGAAEPAFEIGAALAGALTRGLLATTTG